jgi:hypothetical protein
MKKQIAATFRALRQAFENLRLGEIPGLAWVWSLRGEIALVAIALVGFAHVAGWIRSVDDTAAPLDLGILSAPAVGAVGVVIAIFLFWTLWRVCFPKEIDRWFDRAPDEEGKSFLGDFLGTSPAVRLVCFFGTLWAVLLTVGLVTLALR